jgi:organic radical activating enzyme
MNLVEIFSSVQGEGPTVGASTLFVRFGRCDLRCRWCDSPHTWRPARECRIQVARGSRELRLAPNPVSLGELVEAAKALDAASHRWASLTGGEPLLQPEAASAAAAALRALGPRIHLETHGLEAEALRGMLGHVDLVSMDWKLASDVRRAEASPETAGVGFHEAHEAFLAVARAAPALVVKIVVTTASRDDEIEAALVRVARSAPGATLVLQPVTPFGPVRERPSAERMLELAARAEALLADVRVIPQTHPIYGAP